LGVENASRIFIACCFCCIAEQFIRQYGAGRCGLVKAGQGDCTDSYYTGTLFVAPGWHEKQQVKVYVSGVCDGNGFAEITALSLLP